MNFGRWAQRGTWLPRTYRKNLHQQIDTVSIPVAVIVLAWLLFKLCLAVILFFVILPWALLGRFSRTARKFYLWQCRYLFAPLLPSHR